MLDESGVHHEALRRQLWLVQIAPGLPRVLHEKFTGDANRTQAVVVDGARDPKVTVVQRVSNDGGVFKSLHWPAAGRVHGALGRTVDINHLGVIYPTLDNSWLDQLAGDLNLSDARHIGRVDHGCHGWGQHHLIDIQVPNGL